MGGTHNIRVCSVGWQRNMTIIGSPDSCLTSVSSRTGPAHSDALIHTQMLIVMYSCPDKFELVVITYNDLQISRLPFQSACYYRYLLTVCMVRIGPAPDKHINILGFCTLL